MQALQVQARWLRPNPHTLCLTARADSLDTVGDSVSAPDPRLRPFRSRDEECVAKASAWANYGMGELHRLGGRGTVLQGKELEGIHKVLADCANNLLALREEASRGTSQATQAYIHETVTNLYAASSIYAQIPISQFRSKFFQVLYTRLMNLDTQKQTLNAMSGNVQRVGAAAHNFATPGGQTPMPTASSAPPMVTNPGGPQGMIPGTPGMQPGIMTPAMIPGTMPFQSPFNMGMMPGMMPGMMMPGMPGMTPPIPYMPGMMPSVGSNQINLPTATLGMPMTVPTVTPGMPDISHMAQWPSNVNTLRPSYKNPHSWPGPTYPPTALR
jgi:hypothetical protein